MSGRLKVGALLFAVAIPTFARERFFGYCQDGNPPVATPDAQKQSRDCTVTVTSRGRQVPLYSDDAGTPKANPFKADSNGYWFFYADDGKYTISLSGSGVLNPHSLDVSGIDPMSLPATISDRGPYPSFFAACEAAASAGLALLVSKSWTSIPSGPCSANLTFYPGGILRLAANAVLAIRGSVVAGLYRIFDTSESGASVALNPSAVKEVYPQWWGALADNSHDDTAEVNAALAAGIFGGIPVSLPAGIYLCNTPLQDVILNINAEVNSNTNPPDVPGGLTVAGSGIGRTIIRTTNSSADLMAAVSSGKTYFPYYNIHDVTLEGPDGQKCNTVGGRAGNGLRITGVSRPFVYLRNVMAAGFCGPGSAGIWLDDAEIFQVDHVRTAYNDIGFKLTTASNASLANNLTADQNHSYGIYIQNLASAVFNAPLVQSNYQTGLYCDRCTNTVWNAAHFENNNFSRTPGKHGLDLESASGYSGYNTFSFLNASPGDDIYLAGNTATRYTNSHNRFIIGAPSGFQQGARINIADGYATGNTWDGFQASFFTADPGGTEELLNRLCPFCSGPSSVSFPSVATPPQAFSKLPACGSAAAPEGTSASVNDSKADAWGAPVTGGGSNHVKVYCNGAQWVVD